MLHSYADRQKTPAGAFVLHNHPETTAASASLLFPRACLAYVCVYEIVKPSLVTVKHESNL